MRGLRQFFNREQFGMNSKISVVKDLLDAIQGKHKFQLTDKKYQVLTDGRVKLLLNQYIGKNILPSNLEQAIIKGNPNLSVTSPKLNEQNTSGNSKDYSSKLPQYSAETKFVKRHFENDSIEESLEFVKSGLMQISENYKNNKQFFSNTHDKVASHFIEKINEISNLDIQTAEYKMIFILTLTEYLSHYLEANHSKKFLGSLHDFLKSNNLDNLNLMTKLMRSKLQVYSDENSSDFAMVSDFTVGNKSPITFDIVSNHPELINLSEFKTRFSTADNKELLNEAQSNYCIKFQTG